MFKTLFSVITLFTQNLNAVVTSGVTMMMIIKTVSLFPPFNGAFIGSAHPVLNGVPGFAKNTWVGFKFMFVFILWFLYTLS